MVPHEMILKASNATPSGPANPRRHAWTRSLSHGQREREEYNWEHESEVPELTLFLSERQDVGERKR